MATFYTFDRAGSLAPHTVIAGVATGPQNYLANAAGIQALSQHGAHYCQWGLLHTVDLSNSQLKFADLDVTLEMVFELVRASYYPACQSRLASMFAWQTPAAAKAFRGKVGGEVYEVSTSGRSLIVDMNWLNILGNADQLYNRAHGYWQQLPMPGHSPEWEVLLEVPVSVGPKVP